jgi:putative transposase
MRAKIILSGANGQSSSYTAGALDLNRETTSLWRSRWIEVEPKLSLIEKSNDEDALKQLDLALRLILKDAPRPGGPPKFTPQQNAQITAIACEKPDEPNDPETMNQGSVRPITHWSNREIADEAIKRGIVSSISVTQVGRFLKRGYAKTA